MIQVTIQRVLDFYAIPGTVGSVDFELYKSIATKKRGVYVISDADGVVIYVGKGEIRTRQAHHYRKAHEQFWSGTKDTEGWKWLRENHVINTPTWRLDYVEIAGETAISALETGLIHLLKPLANDETLKDRQ